MKLTMFSFFVETFFTDMLIQLDGVAWVAVELYCFMLGVAIICPNAK